ncbi:MAG: flippase [bacterium]|nr:flippase [bacterium]
MDKIILKNSVWLLGAQVLTKVVAFFYTFFLAQNLSVGNNGIYFVALSYFSILSSFADFGISRFLIREISQKKETATSYILSATLLRVAIAFLIFICLSIVLLSYDHNQVRVTLSIIAVFAIIPQIIGITLDNVFASLQKFHISALGILILNISNAIIGVFFIKSGFGPLGVVTALLLSQIVFVLALFVMFRKEHVVIEKVVTKKQIKEILKGSIPYGLLSILGLLYFRIDILLLSYIRGHEETAFYGLSYKFLEAVIFIPSAFGAALFPFLAEFQTKLKQGITSTSDLKKFYYKSLLFMGVLGVVTLIGYIFVLPIVIRLFLPKYLASIQTITILAFTIPFMFIHNPGVQIILSTDKYLRLVIFLSVITLAFNLVFNFILIPQYGYIGAAWVTVLSEIFSFLVFYWLLRAKFFKEDEK